MRRIPLILALCYPLLAHIAVALADTRLVLVSAALLLALMLMPVARRSPARFVVLSILALALLAGLSRLDATILLLYVPPVAFNAFIGWIFARSLRAGSMPLIESVARAFREPGAVLAEDVLAYARRLTLLWALLLFTLAALNFGLALLADPGGLLRIAGIAPPIAVSQAVWSWFANVFNYLIVAFLFVVEWFVRKHRFPDHVQVHSFSDFALRLAALGPRLWRGSAH